MCGRIFWRVCRFDLGIQARLYQTELCWVRRSFLVHLQGDLRNTGSFQQRIHNDNNIMLSTSILVKRDQACLQATSLTHPFPEASPDPNLTLTQTPDLTQGRVCGPQLSKVRQKCVGHLEIFLVFTLFLLQQRKAAPYSPPPPPPSFHTILSQQHWEGGGGGGVKKGGRRRSGKFGNHLKAFVHQEH